MDLRLLHYFVAVADARQFRRAADRLGIAQPPLTRAIQLLECRLGLKLLLRERDGVRVTHAGAVLLEHSNDLLARHATLVATMSELKLQRRTPVVLAYCGAGAGLLPSRLMRVLRAAGTEVRLVDLGIGAEAGALQDAAIDAAILVSRGDHEPGLEKMPLRRVPVVMAVPPGGESSGPRVGVRGVPGGWPVRLSGISAPEVLADSYDQALDLVAAGCGVMLTLTTCAERHAREDVEYRSVIGVTPMAIDLVWRAHTEFALMVSQLTSSVLDSP